MRPIVLLSSIWMHHLPPCLFSVRRSLSDMFPYSSLPSRSQIKDWQSNQAALEFTRTSTWLSEQVKSTAAIRHFHCFLWTCLSVCPPPTKTQYPHKFQSSHCDSTMLSWLRRTCRIWVGVCVRMYTWSLLVKSCCCIDPCLFFFYYNRTSTAD